MNKFQALKPPISKCIDELFAIFDFINMVRPLFWAENKYLLVQA